MKIKLELMNGAQDGEEFRIRETTVIGRDKSAQLSLPLDKYISRKNSRLVVEAPDVYLEDLNSTNGTYYEGEKINELVRLYNGDFFRVGRTWMEITW
ncbi:MAG: FHA domain-containing protein [Vulcanimicrobiota bacterium]